MCVCVIVNEEESPSSFPNENRNFRLYSKQRSKQKRAKEIYFVKKRKKCLFSRLGLEHMKLAM